MKCGRKDVYIKRKNIIVLKSCYFIIICYKSPVSLTEMSDTLPTSSLLCGPGEVNVGGSCKSEDPAVVFLWLSLVSSC